MLDVKKCGMLNFCCAQVGLHLFNSESEVLFLFTFCNAVVNTEQSSTVSASKMALKLKATFSMINVYEFES